MWQREVQQGFFSSQQPSLFTAHLTIGKEQQNVAIISDRLEHETAFVYCAQEILLEFVKKKFPQVKKLVRAIPAGFESETRTNYDPYK